MSQTIYEPVADGVYENKGSIISVGRGQCLSIAEKKKHMRVWVGLLPNGWRVCKPVEVPHADWSKAPEWVMWWAVDAEGQSWWYEEEPSLGDIGWYNGGESVEAEWIDIPLGIDWRTLKERRPELAS